MTKTSPASTRASRPPRWPRCHLVIPGRVAGQAVVEFSFAGVIFLLIVLGTVDFGRVIFTYVQLHNAVREGARYGKVHCDEAGWVAATEDEVIARSPTLGLTGSDIDVNLDADGCVPPNGAVTVSAETEFTAIAQVFLGIDPLTLTAAAVVDVE